MKTDEEAEVAAEAEEGDAVRPTFSFKSLSNEVHFIVFPLDPRNICRPFSSDEHSPDPTPPRTIWNNNLLPPPNLQASNFPHHKGSNNIEITRKVYHKKSVITAVNAPNEADQKWPKRWKQQDLLNSNSSFQISNLVLVRVSDLCSLPASRLSTFSYFP